jgi:hypothetical protein
LGFVLVGDIYRVYRAPSLEAARGGQGARRAGNLVSAEQLQDQDQRGVLIGDRQRLDAELLLVCSACRRVELGSCQHRPGHAVGERGNAN